MKKYLAGFLMLGVMVFTGALPSKVNAGAMTNAQIIAMLQAAGVTPQALAQVTAALGMSTTAGTTTTAPGTVNPNASYPYGTTPTTGGGSTSGNGGGSLLPCTNNAAFNFTNGNPCTNYIHPTTPQTGGPLYYTPTNPQTGGPSYPPTTPPTASNCVSNLTAVAPYVIINGAHVPCVKVCPGNMVAWNVVTSTLCAVNPNIVVTPPSTTDYSHSVTVASPNGAEEYMSGATMDVKWESTGIPTTNDQVILLLKYYTPEGVYINSVKLLDHLTVNDGVETVKLPADLPAGATWGNNFKVSVSIQTVTDDSDKNFIIQ